MQYKHNTLVIPLQRNQLTDRKIMDELTDIYKRIEYLRNNEKCIRDSNEGTLCKSATVPAAVIL